MAAGDTVVFVGPRAWLDESPLPQEEIRPAILYEDTELLVIDKPAHVATHGFSARDVNTLANFVAAYYPEILDVGRSRWEPGLIHRLDRETSGLVLIAKTQTAFEHLRNQFRNRVVGKHYLALVEGVTEVEGSIDMPLAHDRRDRRRMRPAVSQERQKNWRALTRYRRRATARGFSFLEVQMTTGVTHQVRAHLAARNHPIVGDRVYGHPAPAPLALDRHFLHAFRLEFLHPGDERPMVVDSKLPADLDRALKILAIEI